MIANGCSPFASQIYKFAALSLLFCGAYTTPIFGCPGFLSADKTLPALAGIRKNIRLYKITASQQWDQIPVQIEPLNKEHLLDLPKDNDPMNVGMQAFDRIVFNPEEFGLVFDKQKFPCNTKHLLEIKLPNGTYGYLAACQDQVKSIQDAHQDVTHNKEKFIVESDLYSYEYQPNNQLMYKHLTFQDPVTDKRLNGGSNANLLLYLDLRHFFTLSLDNDQVRSEVSGSWTGPLGTLSNVSFYLKLFLFKLDLKMDSSIAFYKNSAMIPMKFEAPADSPNVLNEDSGILYFWQPDDAKIDQSHPQNSIPDINAPAALKGYKDLAKIGLPYCKQDFCKYVLKGSLADNPFAIEMVVPQYMVEVGFFPMFVGDTQKFVRDMDWDALEDQSSKVGIYFNNSGLPKGMHEMSQWIRMGEQDFAQDCPLQSKINRIISF